MLNINPMKAAPRELRMSTSGEGELDMIVGASVFGGLIYTHRLIAANSQRVQKVRPEADG